MQRYRIEARCVAGFMVAVALIYLALIAQIDNLQWLSIAGMWLVLPAIGLVIYAVLIVIEAERKYKRQRVEDMYGKWRPTQR